MKIEGSGSEHTKHVVVFARRFSVSKLTSPPCVVAGPIFRPRRPIAAGKPAISAAGKPAISVEVVNINKVFHQNNDIVALKKKFRKKYDKKNREIDVDVYKLESSHYHHSPNFPPRKRRSSSRSQKSSKTSKRFSKTISFDSEGNVTKEEYTTLFEDAVFDDPLGNIDYSENKTYFESFAEPEDKASQTFFKTSTKQTTTQTRATEIEDHYCQTERSTPGRREYGVQTSIDSRIFEKIPDITVTPAQKLQNDLNRPSIFMEQKSEPARRRLSTSDSRLKDIINNLHSQYVDKPLLNKGENSKLNKDEHSKLNSVIENLHTQYFSPDISSDPQKSSTKTLKDNFESRGSLKADQVKHELRKSNVRSQIDAMKTKSKHTKVDEEELLKNLMSQTLKLPTSKLVEFEKTFVKNMTEREFIEIVKSRLKCKRGDNLADVIKDLCTSVDMDDLYDIVEQSLHERPYSEGRSMSMKFCENFLNKKDMTEFIKRNHGAMSEANKKMLATALLEDLPYDAMRAVLQLQFPKLKDKDIPNILNNIQTDPNSRELEKAVCILSSRLTGEETQKLIKALGKGMKDADITRTIKQLFDYLPVNQSETIARKYVQVKRFYAEKWTETKAVEVKKTLEKQVGTDSASFIRETVEKSRKIVKIHGESWFAGDKKVVNRSTQTDAVNRLLFKDKVDLQNASAMIKKAKQRFQNKVRNTEGGSHRDAMMLGQSESPTPGGYLSSRIGRSVSQCDTRSSTPDIVETDSGSDVVTTRRKLLDEIERLKQEKHNIHDEYQEYFNLAVDLEEDLRYQEDELERTKRSLNDATLECAYINQEKALADNDIKDLEDELADAKIMIYDLRNRPLTGKPGRQVNVANAVRLTKELERFRGMDEDLALLQEDYQLMENKWLAEQKQKKYYEKQAEVEQSKSKEMSQQLYMLITNELTPKQLKEKIMHESPDSLTELPQLTGAQLNALLTLFVAAGALPPDKVPTGSQVFTIEELQKSSYTSDQVANLLTGNVDSPEGGMSKIPIDDPEMLKKASLLGLKAVGVPEHIPAGMSLVSNETLLKASLAAPPPAPTSPGSVPPPPPAPPAPRAPVPPTAPKPPNAPPMVGAPPAPKPPNAPPMVGAPPAPRPPNAPPLVGAPPPPPPLFGAPLPGAAPLVVDDRLLAGQDGTKGDGRPGSGAFVPRGRLEDLKKRSGRRDRSNRNQLLPKKKMIPGPTKPLKIFNWIKLPEAKAANSIWKDIDEVEMVTMLKLDEIDELFQSKKAIKRDVGDGKKKSVQIVDAKRAQNFTILLKKFHLTNEELVDIIMDCDKDGKISIDMWEQLLRYIPSNDEAQLLKELEADPDTLAALNRADRYFFSAVSIYHYEERIKAVNFQKKFDERVKLVKPKLRALIKASTEIVKSEKLKELLTLILAFGNYFNYGKRGNAMGFKMETLTKLCDTKAVDNKLTLMVYMVETIEIMFEEFDDFVDEIPHATIASKISLSELKADVNELQSGYRLLQKEVVHMEKNPQLRGAIRFKNVFNVFMEGISETMVEIEQLMGDMKKKYTIATSHFAESSSVEPEVFFGYFNIFIQQYMDAKEVLAKKREEEDKKRKRQVAADMYSACSSPIPRSRPLSPTSGANSPIPHDIFINNLPSLDVLDQQDHELMMGGLFGSDSPDAPGLQSGGSTRRRRKKRTNITAMDRERT